MSDWRLELAFIAMVGISRALTGRRPSGSGSRPCIADQGLTCAPRGSNPSPASTLRTAHRGASGRAGSPLPMRLLTTRRRAITRIPALWNEVPSALRTSCSPEQTLACTPLPGRRVFILTLGSPFALPLSTAIVAVEARNHMPAVVARMKPVRPLERIVASSASDTLLTCDRKAEIGTCPSRPVRWA